VNPLDGGACLMSECDDGASVRVSLLIESDPHSFLLCAGHTQILHALTEDGVDLVIVDEQTLTPLLEQRRPS
jgi:hypothetical protein